MAPTEDERFSQHTTTVKRLKFPSVIRPPDSLPFVAMHIFFCIKTRLKYIRFRH